MRYFDPARPQSSEWPLYTGPEVGGRTIPLPELYCAPQVGQGGQPEFELRAMMAVSSNAFRTFYAVVSDIGAFYARWLENPEQVLRDEFKYTFDAKEFAHRATQRRTKVEVDTGLAALGLDD